MSQETIFESVDLKKEDPSRLTEQINEFISRIRKNHEIGVEEANDLLDDVNWILDNYSYIIDDDKKDTLRNGSSNVVLSLDSTKAVLLLQVIRESIKPLTKQPGSGDKHD